MSDPLAPHSHDPNPEPPSADPAITLVRPDGRKHTLRPNDLRRLPQSTLENCYIVSTGHGTSGPFAFSGPSLKAVADHYAPGAFSQVEVIAGDGFGTRVAAVELERAEGARAPILALERDGRSLSRDDGLVRLIVPSETDDALRQVKWVARINIKAD